MISILSFISLEMRNKDRIIRRLVPTLLFPAWPIYHTAQVHTAQKLNKFWETGIFCKWYLWRLTNIFLTWCNRNKWGGCPQMSGCFGSSLGTLRSRWLLGPAVSRFTINDLQLDFHSFFCSFAAVSRFTLYDMLQLQVHTWYHNFLLQFTSYKCCLCVQIHQ